MDEIVFAALGDASRLRIVEALNAAPHAVGEIALQLGLRQPQATKHLQLLERAGLVAVHPLGRRRIYALRREALRELAASLEPFGRDRPSEGVLADYARAVETEQRSAGDARSAVGRILTFDRAVTAPRKRVWAAWTDPALVREWWSPDHFSVAECEVDAVPGGAVRIVMQEGDGTRYVSAGRFVSLDAPGAFTQDLSALVPGGGALLTTQQRLRLTKDGPGSTRLHLEVEVLAATEGAAPALAGMQPGWEQLLANLERVTTAR